MMNTFFNCFHEHIAYTAGNVVLQIAAEPLQIETKLQFIETCHRPIQRWGRWKCEKWKYET